MDLFEYRVIPFYTTGTDARAAANDAAKNLYTLITQQQAQGFEYQRMDHVIHTSNPGCLGALMGATAGTTHIALAVFRSRRS